MIEPEAQESSYLRHRDEALRVAVRNVPLVVTTLVAVYAFGDWFLQPGKFWAAALSYALLIGIGAVIHWVLNGPFREHPVAALLGLDFAWTAALSSQLAFAGASTSGSAMMTCLKIVSTASLFPWGPQAQLVSGLGAILWFVMALLYAGSAAPTELHLVMGPVIALLISLATSEGSDRDRRARFGQSQLLRTSEGRLRQLVEQLPVVVWTTDLALKVTHAAGSGLLRLTSEPNPGSAANSTEAFAGLRHNPAAQEAHQRALLGQVGNFELMSNGRTFACSVEALRDADGATQGTVGVALDISERKRAEDAQREEAHTIEALGRVARELIAVRSLSGLTERICTLACEILQADAAAVFQWDAERRIHILLTSRGLTLHEREEIGVLGTPEAAALAMHDALQALPLVALRVSDTSNPQAMSVLRRIGLGVTTHMALRIGDDMFGSLVVARRAERPLSGSERRLALGIAQLSALALQNALLVSALKEANNAKSEFVATMSHELRTPLNVIIGYNTMMLEGEFGSLSAEQSETTRRTLRQAHHLHELISATLDFSRVESGRMPVDVAPLPLDEFFARLRSEVPPTWQKPRVELRWDIPDGLPTIETDAGKLTVITKNLVSNAIKFTENGSVTVSVRCTTAVEIRVSDTGIGIPPDQCARVFQAFEQVEGGRDQSRGGVGLGLYIVRQLVTMLDGQISLESEVGKGSTFTLRLPLVARVGESTIADPAEPSRLSPPGAGSGY